MTPPAATQGVNSLPQSEQALVPILLYHSVSDDASRAYRDLALRPAAFEAQMRHLATSGFTPLTVSGFVALRRAGAALPQRPVLITFDDGFDDFYTHALPVLVEHGFPATLYLVSGHIGGTSRWLDHHGEGTRRLLGWREICECQASGVECGSHTETHPELDTLPLHSARDEIALSKDALEDALSAEVRTFAYPHGHYDRAVRELVVEAGYESACAVKNAMSFPADDVYALARITVTAGTSVATFGNALRGKGIRRAWDGERMQTRAWRSVRRARARNRRATSAGSASAR